MGDTHFDARGAKDAGIGFLGVSYGFGKERELTENGAEEVFASARELEAYFEQLKN